MPALPVFRIQARRNMSKGNIAFMVIWFTIGILVFAFAAFAIRKMLGF